MIILIIGLAVVALIYGATRVSSRHSIRSPNPVAPLVGAVDRAKAVAMRVL